ncbi:indolepyruvate ferredoxin oxidoreductase family protein [Vineibacter terrae]|uniref:Indolepyruvate ferredoxin oxidoreductase family protein n=1 Tax=Vineibacter terrae TaxID=2586908 RepID=A0A5C8PUD4_9HYPH|nr:indolepyruvate ferredoxin oxidoreductase family protein [Vineibacter terrae]TXL81691.1 indolepyruvate ferredoxin oxidoreductase family protein [Vineibacter terrae]
MNAPARIADVTLDNYTLEDRYIRERGRVYLTGIQALVRLPMMQKQRDQKAGLNTGGFISGYRGSPLGMYDNALWGAKKHLARHNIHFQPGLNEDLAATAVWGTQQTNLFPTATVDGVFAIWYGKGPGVDRSMDVLKHGNAAGSSKNGGVLVYAGDDHGCQSSTLPHQSEQVFTAAMIPVLNPATVQEYIDFGILGFAMSRYSGCWIGFKAISETVESGASVDVDPERIKIVIPTDFDIPEGGLNIRNPDPPLDQERRLHGPKMEAVKAFARANGIDRVVLDAPKARLGVMTTGKAYLDTRQALEDLGITEAKAQALGIRLYKVGMTWPLEPAGARAFADGLEEIIVVEEKRSNLEDQLVKLLYNLPGDRRPIVIGKEDEDGRRIQPTEGELSPTGVARVIADRLMKHGGDSPEMRQRLARVEAKEKLLAAPASKTVRTPFFCSGCPHNTSTRVPEGSRALAGIGCHGMAVWMPDRRTSLISHMGGEGVTWIGTAPFTSEKHVFQNLGDGTYHHSGLMAIRAAAAAGVNITYKILFNDAVAMTGGQPHDGPLTVPQITQQVAAEGANRIVVVTDEPDKYPAGTNFAPGVTIRHRDELDAIQRELREVPGLTVIVYDQTCAAEKRRRRKRGTFPDPQKRAFINDAVCEGCGDCSEKSNCVSVKPLETELGRKRQIDQSNCNKDFSCVNGFCPSFVTVHGGRLKRNRKAAGDAAADPFANLPMPTLRPLSEPYGILVTGIGGTGVITVGALIGMAAHLEGRGCTVLDFTGLAQKNGAVMSHIRLAPAPADLHAVRIAAGGANLVLGCDMVVAASPGALSRIEQGVTKAVINAYVQPTASFVLNNDIDFEQQVMMRSIREAAGTPATEFVDATGLATAILGDSIATNLFMLGYAWQKGLVPLSLAALHRAIELNGVAVEANIRTLNWGRLAAHDPEAVEAVARPQMREEKLPQPTLDELVKRRVELLTQYQDAAYAERYRAFVGKAIAAEQEKTKGRNGFAEAVAKSLYKLMAYKDEYEVARLYTDGEFLKKLRQQFEGDFKLKFNLAPPLLADRDPATGHLIKGEYGPWVFTMFKVLAKLKGLRGTRLDIFGRTEERKTERRLIEEYMATISDVIGALSPQNHAMAVQIAALPDQIRGFGHVKEKNLAKVKEREANLLAAFRKPAAPPALAAE